MCVKHTNKVAITRSRDAFLIIQGKPTLRDNVRGEAEADRPVPSLREAG